MMPREATRSDLSRLTHAGLLPGLNTKERSESSGAPARPSDNFLARLTLLLQPPAVYSVKQTPPTQDGSLDLIAWRQEALGLETRLWIQCKNHQSPVGVSVLRELRGVVPDRMAGGTPVVVCPAGFGAEARAFAAAQGMQLWGLEELDELGCLFEYNNA